MLRRLALLLAAACLLAGCGEEAAGKGNAALWITRDRGSEVILTATVPAEISAMEALRRKADVETRYGGRFVHSIEDIEGGVTDQRDWFFYVNGYEADLSAAEYRLRDGDVAWWDFRAWEREGEARVVVGAFPEPFLHGYAGKTRPAVVRYEGPQLRRANAIARGIGASSVAPLGTPVPRGANVFELRSGPDRATAELLGETAGDPVRFVLSGELDLRRRYSIP